MAIRAITAGNSGLRDTLPAAGADGGLWLIAREGSPFEVAPADSRLVSDILIRAGSGGEDGRMSPFNDADQLVYRLTFTDETSRLFLATGPQPGAAALVMPAGGALLVRLPHRRAARA